MDEEVMNPVRKKQLALERVLGSHSLQDPNTISEFLKIAGFREKVYDGIYGGDLKTYYMDDMTNEVMIVMK